MGVCDSACRIAINHRNIKNMLGQFTSILGEADMNIAHLANQSKGEYAYTLLDLDTPVTPETVEELKRVEGVLKIRVL